MIPPGEGNLNGIPVIDPAGIARKELDVSYTPGKPHPMRKLDVYLPEEGGGPFPVLIHMHGGGFVGGLKNDAHVVSYLTEALKRGYAFASVEQRLCSPKPGGAFDAEGCFPNPLFDFKAAIRFLRANAGRFMLDPDRFALLGPSAGGYHVAMAAATQDVQAMYDPSLGFSDVSGKVQAVVDLFGVGDLALQAAFPGAGKQNQPDSQPVSQAGAGLAGAGLAPNFADVFFGAEVLKHPNLAYFANPETWVTPDMPPILIQAGEADQVVPVECSRSLAKRIAAVCGKERVEYDEFPGYIHGDERFHDPANHERMFAWIKGKLS